MKFNKIVNFLAFIYIVFLFIYSFLVNVTRLGNSRDVFYYPDKVRDAHVSQFINKYNTKPAEAPWCGNCKKEYHLINSKIYYYLLAPFSFSSDGSSLLYFCSFWFALMIPLVFILTTLTSNIYAGVLAATIMFQSSFMSKYITWMPYQPLFTPTMSIVLLIFLVLAKKHNSIWYFLFSTITLFLGIQFHLSFLLLGVLYFWLFLKLFKDLKGKKLVIISIFILFLGLFLFFNTDLIVGLPDSVSYPSVQIASFSSFITLLSKGLFDHYNDIFGKTYLYIYVFVLSFIFNFKKYKYKFLFLTLAFYPIFAIGSHVNNYLTVLYIPIFIVLFSSIVLGFKNIFLFILILCLVISLNGNKPFEERISFGISPTFVSRNFLSEINHDLDQFTQNIPNYCVYKCKDSSLINFDAGYFFYKIWIGESTKSYFETACDDDVALNNNQKNFFYCTGDDCKYIIENNDYKIYDFEKIGSKGDRSFFLINRK
ncbi:hypothetical protein SDC9_102349 [bioreactor metagenome]|uniref:Uncharacterized protein n=1 Tax=bioreactor metagenome TaxID=1076179 RepID=A0A645AQL6_9ZZZZ